MTTKSPQELAASLRTIHGARRHHSFTGHGEPVFAIMGNAERLADIELAASMLDAPTITHDQLREAALDVMSEAGITDGPADVLAGLCIKLGVVL